MIYSIGCGDLVVKGPFKTTKEAIDTIKLVQNTNKWLSAIELLRQNDHYHRWGRDRQCSCGLFERDYRASGRDSVLPCYT